MQPPPFLFMRNLDLSNPRQENDCRLIILLVTLLLLAYSNSFNASWQLDDSPNILTNRKIHINELTSKAFWDAMTADPGRPNSVDLRRPVSRLSLGLNWFWSQTSTTGYHIVNFIIHVISSILLYYSVKTLFLTPRLKNLYTSGEITFIAIFSTLLWALNPVQVQAVTYIIQRMTSLATLFSLLAILLYFKVRLSKPGVKRALLTTLTIISYILAIFSKQNAVIIILMIPFLELILFKTKSIKISNRSILIIFFSVVILSALLIFAIRPDILEVIADLYSRRPFTLIERLLTEQRIIVFYLSLLFFPHPSRLSIQHDIILSTSLFSPVSTFFAILLNIGLFTSALILYKRRPLLSLAIIFFYINHLVESTFIPLELLFEHRNYLPSLFLFIPISLLFLQLLKKVRKKILSTYAVILLLATILGTLAYATYVRNQDWLTIDSLWTDALEKAPMSARPLSTLAYEFGWEKEPTRGNFLKAIEMNARSLELDKDKTDLDSKILGNMAILKIKIKDYPGALSLYQQALQLEPNNYDLRFNYAKLLLWLGRLKEAESQAMTLIDARFFHPDVWNLLAVIDIWQDIPTRALQYLQSAYKYSPNRYDLNLHLGKCFSLLGYHDKAHFFYQRALDLQHGKNNIILSLLKIENNLLRNDYQKARYELEAALLDHPVTLLLKPISKNYTEKYKNIRLESALLKSFINEELHAIDAYIKE